MDFKARFPMIPQHFFRGVKRESPEPYDKLSFIYEIQLATEPFIFLAEWGNIKEETGLATEYLLEAPRNCVMRKAFEFGEISSDDYWTHKGWMIELTTALGIGSTQARYIRPNEVCSTTQDHRDEHYERGGPMMIKYKRLEEDVDKAELNVRLDIIRGRKARDPRDAERRYQDFMMRHGERLFRQKTA